jgi:hypothetical protein
MPDVPPNRRDLRLRLALAGEVLLFLGHGALLAAQNPQPAATIAHGRVFGAVLASLADLGVSPSMAIPLFGAVAGSASILLVAAFAAGVDGLRMPALVPPLFLAASPVFAHAAFTNGESAVLTTLLLATGYRSFSETHTHGRLPISALCGGLAAAIGRAGALAFMALFLQKVAFARKFRLPRAVAVFAVVWLVLGLAVTGSVLLALAATGHSSDVFAPPPPAGSVLASGVRTLGAFISAVNGLALLPFVLALVLAWKPKEIYFRLTLAAAALIAILIAAVRVPAAGLGPALAPALPWGFLIAGEALAHAETVLQSSGLRGRALAVLASSVIAALALAELVPTLAGAID